MNHTLKTGSTLVVSAPQRVLFKYVNPHVDFTLKNIRARWDRDRFNVWNLGPGFYVAERKDVDVWKKFVGKGAVLYRIAIKGPVAANKKKVSLKELVKGLLLFSKNKMTADAVVKLLAGRAYGSKAVGKSSIVPFPYDVEGGEALVGKALEELGVLEDMDAEYDELFEQLVALSKAHHQALADSKYVGLRGDKQVLIFKMEGIASVRPEEGP